MLKAKIYVFFDLDRTILKYDTMLLFCNYILQKHRIRHLYLFLLIPAYFLFFIKCIKETQLKSVFFSFLYKLPKEKLKEYSQDFVENFLLKLCFPEIIERIKFHKKSKHKLILNTASVNIYAKLLGEKLGFDNVYCTRIKIKKQMPLFPKIIINNKKFSKIKKMLYFLKKETMVEFIDQKKLLAIHNIKNSFVYTDNLADLPLIRLGDKINIVEPLEKKLIKMAKINKWEIIKPKKGMSPCFSFIKRTCLAILMLNGLFIFPKK